MKFIVLEYDVLDNDNLTNTEKLLYGYIVALSQNDRGFCFASTQILCELMRLKPRQLKYCLSSLKKYNYISIVIEKNKRYITPTINKFIESRKEENSQKVDLFDYNWLEEDGVTKNETN